MGPWDIALVVAAFSGVAILMSWENARRRRRVQGWAGLAQRLGLRFFRGGLIASPRLEGNFEGVQLRLAVDQTDDSSDYITYIEAAPAPPMTARWDPAFKVAQKSGATKAVATWIGEICTTGDREFDERFRVQGDAVICRAILGPSVRRTIARIGAVVSAGKVRVRADEVASDLEALEFLLRSAASVAREISVRSLEPARALARNATEEESADLRLASFEALCAQFPKELATHTVATKALSDASPDLRAEAALFVQPAEERHLESAVADAMVALPRRVRALRALMARLENSQIENILTRVSDKRALLDALPSTDAASRRAAARLSALAEGERGRLTFDEPGPQGRLSEPESDR
ncbi:MAG: hypothetical protein JNJ88_08835 [Planctomycetes bacterium]|nr:hypothetical protein [Planctomycetota bacterium]